MPEAMLPTTMIEGHEIGRLVIGTNWFLGHSHQSAARSKWIRRYQDAEKIAGVLEICTAGGMNAIVAPISALLVEAMELHRRRTGRHIIQILTPAGKDLDELKAGIDRCAELGAEFCFPHTGWTDSRLHPATNEITEYEEAAAYIRSKGMAPGLSTHRPEAIVVGDRAGYDIAAYLQPIQSYRLPVLGGDRLGGQRHPQHPKPVIVIKPLAAGRLNPPTGLSFAFANIKPTDVVCIGLLCEEEAEGPEITRQILAARPRRSSCSTPAQGGAGRRVSESGAECGVEAPADFSRDLGRALGHDVAELWEWPGCALCGAAERVTVVREDFARCPLEIVRCAACGFCYSRPRPTALLSDLIRRPATRNALVDAECCRGPARAYRGALRLPQAAPP